MSQLTASSKQNKLRLITYLAPGHPVQLYQVYQEYLEEALGMESYLMVEGRWSVPPQERTDPFEANDVDIGFICSTGYLRYMELGSNYIELLPAAPIHIHPKSELRPIYFSDVIVHKSRSETYKILHDLKGARWGYNEDMSLSGNIVVLAELKRMGESPAFFGNSLLTGSHLESIQMVLQNRVDAAAIDSTVLHHFLEEHPEYKKELHVLCSLGPLPVQPVILNSKLPKDLKDKITDAFLNMNKSDKWKDKLAKHHVWGFKPVNSSLYEDEKAIREIVKNKTITNMIYY